MSILGTIAIRHFEYELRCDIREKLSMLSNTHLWTFVHKFDAGKYSSQHILQAMSLRAHMLQNTSCAAKCLVMRMHASDERGHTFRYLVPSRTRNSFMYSPAVYVSITRANKEIGRSLQLSSDRRWKDRTCKGNTISW